jgi:DNA repair exonuclease SbcCD ATPase subunit
MNYFKNLKEEKERLNLKSEKVELSIADDVKKLYSKYIDLEEAESMSLRSVNDSRNDLEKMESKYKNLLKEIGAMEKKLDKAINDLGVGRGTFGLDDDLRKAKDGAEQRIKFLSKAISTLNNIY